MSIFRLWLENQGLIKNEVESILARSQDVPKLLEKFGGNHLGSLAHKIVQTDPSPNKDFATSIASWVVSGDIESLDEHNPDIEEFLRLKREFRKTWGTERDSLDKKEYKDVKKLFKEIGIFEHPWDLSQRNDEIRKFIKDMGGVNWHLIDRLKVAEKDGFVVYRVPAKGEVRGFNPKSYGKTPLDPFHSSRTSWCVVGGHYGGYGGGPYYCVRQGKQWYGCVIPGYLHDPTQALRNPKNNGMLGATEIDKLYNLLGDIVPQSEIKMRE